MDENGIKDLFKLSTLKIMDNDESFNEAECEPNPCEYFHIIHDTMWRILHWFVYLILFTNSLLFCILFTQYTKC